VQLPAAVGKRSVGEVDVEPDPVRIGDYVWCGGRPIRTDELVELGRERGLVETLVAVFDEPSSKNR
jgi:hypothetical protein